MEKDRRNREDGRRREEKDGESGREIKSVVEIGCKKGRKRKRWHERGIERRGGRGTEKELEIKWKGDSKYERRG